MKVKFRGSYKGWNVVLFSNGDIHWGSMEFPKGTGANAGLLAYLKAAMEKSTVTA